MIADQFQDDINSISTNRLLDEIEKICSEFTSGGEIDRTTSQNVNGYTTLPVEVPRIILEKIDSMKNETPLTRSVSENLQILAKLSFFNQHKDNLKLENVMMKVIDLIDQAISGNYHHHSSRRDSTLQEMESKYINEMKEKDILIADLRAKVEVGLSTITAMRSATYTDTRVHNELESKLFSMTTEKENLERQIESYQLQYEHMSKQVNNMTTSSSTSTINENNIKASTEQALIVSSFESTIQKHLLTIEGLENSIHLLNETIEQYEEKCSASLDEISSLKLSLAKYENDLDKYDVEDNNANIASPSSATAGTKTPSTTLMMANDKPNEDKDKEEDEIEVAEDMDENEYDDDDDGMALFETVDALRRRVAELEMWLEIERAKNSPMKQIKLRQLVRESFLQPGSARKSTDIDTADIDNDHDHDKDKEDDRKNGNRQYLFKTEEKKIDSTFKTPTKASDTDINNNSNSSNINDGNTRLIQERDELKAENTLLIERSIALYDKTQELQSVIDSFRVEYGGGILSVPLTTVLKSPRSSASMGGGGGSSLLYNTASTSPRSRLVTPRVTITTPRVEENRMSNNSHSNISNYTTTNNNNIIVAKKILKTSTTATTPINNPTKNSSTTNEVVEIDRHRFFTDSNTPIVYIEIGSFYSRVGMWNWTEQRFEMKFTCRTCQAVAVNDKDRYDVVRHAAASQTDDMYQNFREKGYFIGSDAIYCCFDHPDRGLRSSLKILPIIVDGCINDMKAYEGLLEHCLERGAMRFDANNIQLLLAYKLTYSTQVMENIITNLFEDLQCASVCLLSEASLVSHSITNAPVSAIIVDIGAYTTTVVPIYENMIIQNAAGSTNIGGEHITEYLTTLLYAQQNETYNGLMPRRCKEIARQIKENCCYIAESFVTEQVKYGQFEFQSIQVMGMGIKNSLLSDNQTVGGNNTNNNNNGMSKSTKLAGVAKSSLTSAHKKEKANEIRTTLDCALLDGSPMFMTADIERFHCTEILFQPDLYEECRYANSLVDAILKSILQLDECVQSEICCHVILGGGSSCIPGLATRLQTELTAAIAIEDIALPSSGVKVYTEEETPFKNKAWESFAKAATSSTTSNTNTNANNRKNGSSSSSSSSNNNSSNTNSPVRVRAKSVYVRGSEASESDINCTRSAVLTGATARVKSALKNNSNKIGSLSSSSIAASNFILSDDYEEQGASALIQDMMCY